MSLFNKSKLQEPASDDRTAANSSCPSRDNCPMFELFGLEAGTRIIRSRYCDSTKHTTCARFEKMSQGLQVPKNLLPNGDTLK